ncbi:hypothetical protein ACP3TY_24020 [Pseudomonas rustica]|uniref:hypothetical protein n=1 Tax=Pseudomonas rustica TaxID=2827099 RepID=UPI003CFB44BA
MVDELEQFQQDLLESVRQMKAGEAARVTLMPFSVAEEQSVEASSDIGSESLISIEPASSGQREMLLIRLHLFMGTP